MELLIALLIVLVVLLIISFIPLDQPYKNIFIVIALILLILWLTGNLPGLPR
jgi:hypothetical protein